MPGITHSFELYPPRTAASAAALPAALAALAATRPQYFSVTYGAAGSSTGASFDLVRTVAETTGIDVMAHLTCSGTSVAQTSEHVRRLLDLGARWFLAVRGDRAEGDPVPGLRTAAELVQLIHRVQAERANWGVALPKARVAVAAFVNGHPESRTRTDHLDALLAKQIAGAELAITQLFFHPEDYAAFVDRARRWGITIPIVPGVLPVTSPARLHADARALRRGRAPRPRDRARGRADGGGALGDRRRPRGPLRAAPSSRRALPRSTSTRSTAPTPSSRCSSGSASTGSASHPPAPRRRHDRLPDRHDPRLPAHRPPSRAEARRGGVLGRPHRRDRARAPCGRARAAPRGSAWSSWGSTRRRPRCRTRSATTTTCSTPPSRSGSSPRGSVPLDPAALDTLFTLARGTDAQPPLEMTKWFDSNYHYLVPEIDAATPFGANPERLVGAGPRGRRRRRHRAAGARRSRHAPRAEQGPARARIRPLDRLDDLLPVYAELLAALHDAGAAWVQLDEPALVSDAGAVPLPSWRPPRARAYRALGAASDRPSILVARDLGPARRRAARGARREPDRGDRRRPRPRRVPEAHGDGPRRARREDPRRGVVDGRNVWRADLTTALDRLDAVRPLARRLAVSTATSLLHVPHDARDDPDLPAALRDRLAFADQKVAEVVVLARAVRARPRAVADETAASDRALAAWADDARRPGPGGPRPGCGGRGRPTAPARPTRRASTRSAGSACRRCRPRRSDRSRRRPTSAASAPVSRRGS